MRAASFDKNSAGARRATHAGRGLKGPTDSDAIALRLPVRSTDAHRASPTDLVDDDRFAAFVTMIALMPASWREKVAHHFSKRAIGEKRKAERKAAYAVLTIGIVGSDHEVAEIVHRRLARYASGGWRFERGGPAPVDPTRAAMHCVLTLQKGKVLAASTLRKDVLPTGGKIPKKSRHHGGYDKGAK